MSARAYAGVEINLLWLKEVRTHNLFMLTPDRGGLTAGLFRGTFLSDLPDREALCTVSLVPKPGPISPHSTGRRCSKKHTGSFPPPERSFVDGHQLLRTLLMRFGLIIRYV